MASEPVLTEKILQEIIRRVVEVAQPEKIILFGSAARGEMAPERYPGIARPVSRAEYEQALAIAEGVIRWVESVVGGTEA
jgi:HEPN domain-containing protein